MTRIVQVKAERRERKKETGRKKKGGKRVS